MKITNKELEAEITALEKRRDKLIRVLSLRREVQGLEEGVMPAMGHERIIKTVTATVSQQFDVSLDELKGDKRPEAIARPRQAVFYIIRQLDRHISFPKMAEYFGNRNHGTAMHAVKRIQGLIDTDADFAQKIADCMSQSRLKLSANGHSKPETTK